MTQGKKKLLVILNRLVIGGQALDTIPLLYHLQNDFDILVLYGCKEKDEIEATFLLDTFKNIPLKAIPKFRRSFNPFRDVAAFFSVLGIIRSFKPDIVHTHGVKSGLLGRTASWFRKVPCVIHTFHGHHFHSYFNPLVSTALIIYERLMAKITTKIIAISPTQKQELAVTYRIAPAEKIEIIPLGVDEKLFSDEAGEKRASFREKYALPDNAVAIGIIGRIVPIKNYKLFTAAARATTGNDMTPVVFFVVGDGTEKLAVEQELTNAGVRWSEDKPYYPGCGVIFTSWVPEVAKALYGLDVIMLTSHNEGTPMSLIEAQFCGKPVVATNVGGVKDTFVNNETGFLVKPGDVGEFSEKLGQLTGNKALRAMMGEKAAIFAHENFSKAKEIDSFRLLYQGCTK